MKEKTCFVLMPISETEKYGKGHFGHIYKYLIKEAGERAGYRVERADDDLATNIIIQEILEKIIKSDMVICDLSHKNPNVMYELGIRHSLQKPVVLVKDDQTERVFDTAGIRTFDYDSKARGDKLELDIELLKTTILHTERSEKLTNSPLAALPDDLKVMLSGIKAFENRSAVTRDTGFQTSLLENNYIDILGLSAEVAITRFKEDLVAALNREKFKCRAVVFDPSSDNDSNYEALVAGVLKQRSNLKREQVEELLELSERIESKYSGQKKLEVRCISNVPLLYNIWTSGRADRSPQVAHISVYSYDTERGGPSFRATSPLQPLLYEIQKEFDYVWNNVAKPFLRP